MQQDRQRPQVLNVTETFNMMGSRCRTMLALSVRDAVHDDIPAVADILMRSSRRAYTFMPWAHSDDDFVDFVRASFDEWKIVRIAEADQGPAGFHCLLKDVVDQLFVAPEAQRRGIGSALLCDVMALRPKGFTLRTFRANRAARAFYGDRGLVAIEFGFSEAENEPDVTYRWCPRPETRSRAAMDG